MKLRDVLRVQVVQIQDLNEIYRTELYACRIQYIPDSRMRAPQLSASSGSILFVRSTRELSPRYRVLTLGICHERTGSNRSSAAAAGGPNPRKWHGSNTRRS